MLFREKLFLCNTVKNGKLIDTQIHTIIINTFIAVFGIFVCKWKTKWKIEKIRKKFSIFLPTFCPAILGCHDFIFAHRVPAFNQKFGYSLLVTSPTNVSFYFVQLNFFSFPQTKQKNHKNSPNVFLLSSLTYNKKNSFSHFPSLSHKKLGFFEFSFFFDEKKRLLYKFFSS